MALIGTSLPIGTALAREPGGTQLLGPAVPTVIAEQNAAARKRAQKHRRAVAKGQRAVQMAKSYLGTPYVYGGSTPSGFDCSGFTMYVYGKLGVKLAHNAQAQYGSGRHVSRSDLRPGDLVFFGYGGSIAHVGMYVGDGKFIHSPQTGETVSIQTLSSRTNYVGATRVI